MYYYTGQIRHVVFPLFLPHCIRLYFLDLSKQFKQNTFDIQFIESFYLKYGIYKPREVKNHIKKPLSVYKSHILNRMINKLHIIDCLRTCVRMQPIIALYLEFETVLRFYNLRARKCHNHRPQTNP